MKRLIIAIFFMFVASAYAAEDVSVSADGMTVTIKDPTNDWTWTDSFTAAKYANGIRVNYIRFHPGATNDICTIEDYDDGDVKHFGPHVCADTSDDRKEYYYGSKLRLFLDVNDTDDTWTVSYTTGCSLTIQLWRTQEP